MIILLTLLLVILGYRLRGRTYRKVGFFSLAHKVQCKTGFSIGTVNKVQKAVLDELGIKGGIK